MAPNILRYRNKINGFTLVELLVVIAVVGLLGSIIFAVTRGAGEQGRIAKGMYFSQHLHNSLGSYAAGIWTLDEGTGTAANDISGWENNGTIYNGTWRCATVDPNYTPSGQGCSLQFNGTSSTVTVTDNSSLKPTNAITLEGWFKTSNYAQTDQTIVMKWEGYNFAYLWNGSLPYIWFELRGTDESTRALTSGDVIGNWPITNNTWFHIAETYDGTYMRVYVNGVLYQQKNVGTFTIKGTTSNLNIGSYNASSRWMNGLIDEVRIYATSLTSAQIQSQYYAGLENLFAEGQISEQEYSQRLIE
jgi:prepilin-type N-terminal cleavage/methylation domain-containing protein